MEISVEEGIIPNHCLFTYNETNLSHGLADFAYPGLNRYCFVSNDHSFDDVRAIFPSIMAQLEGDYWWVVGSRKPDRKLSRIEEYKSKKSRAQHEAAHWQYRDSQDNLDIMKKPLALELGEFFFQPDWTTLIPSSLAQMELELTPLWPSLKQWWSMETIHCSPSYEFIDYLARNKLTFLYCGHAIHKGDGVVILTPTKLKVDEICPGNFIHYGDDVCYAWH